MSRKLQITAISLICIVLSAGSLMAAEEGSPMEFKASASLELFYESSDDVGGADDNDKIKSNQFYLTFDGISKDGYAARLMLDGADIVNNHDDLVDEKIVEEANFTIKDIAGSPVSVCFGKDEQPFGLDYDKYLNDSISHMLEIDKVWGVNSTVDICENTSLAVGTYEHRHSLADSEMTTTSDKSLGDSYAAKLMVTKLFDMLTFCISGANEAYSDVSATDAMGVATVTDKDDETRMGAGFILACPSGRGNINVEYISFENMKGTPNYDPALWTFGAEAKVCEKTTVWGRYEMIDDDSDTDVEDALWSIGVQYTPVKNYILMVEYSNFNSGDLSDATDLEVAKGSMEDALLIGVMASY